MAVSVSSVKLPVVLHKKLLSRVIDDGYGLRGRSKWIVDAVNLLLKLPEFEQYVELASDLKNCTEAISIRMPEKLALQLDKTVVQVRQKFPEIEAVKSNIIRASILQRFIRNSHCGK
jgi:hypothetical protein